MKNIETQILINAPIQKVWAEFVATDQYSIWNPFIKLLKGELKNGEQLSVLIQSNPNKKGMEFQPIVQSFIPLQELVWKGHLFVKGLFDGEHYFRFEEIDANRTRFIHGENFSGLLSTVLLKMIGNETEQGFQNMNIALKKLVEGRTSML